MAVCQITDAAQVSGTRITSDGYLTADVLCARTGIQDYLASELGIMGGGTIKVYRPEESVFSKDSMATFVGKPVTMGHPSEPVTADNWKSLAVGDIGEEIARDGEAIRVSIKLMDAAAITAVKDGTREISMGYTTPLSMEDGVTPDGEAYQAVQTGPIRINHLAIVDRARGGSTLRVGDGMDKWGVSPSTTDEKQEILMSNQILKTVVLGDEAVEVSDAHAKTVEKYRDNAAKALTDAQATHDKAIADKDAELAKLQAKLDDAEAKVVSDEDLDKRVAARSELVSQAKAIVADVETAGLSDAAIKKAVVVAKLGDAMGEKSDAYIDARFDILAEEKPDAFADAVKGGVKLVVVDAVDKAIQLRQDRMENAWKSNQKEAS